MKLVKLFIFILIFLNILNAKEYQPSFTYLASSGVSSLVYKDNKIYIGTRASTLDIFDTKTKKRIKSITLEKIKDFMGDLVDSKIYSIDVLDDMILILSQGEKGGRDINIYKDGKLINLISSKERMFIAQAKFISKDKIVFTLLSNQVYLFDIKSKTNIYKKQISQSKFSHFVLSEDKQNIVIADESGIINMLDLKSFNVIKKFEKQNLDNVFQVDLKNNIILTAGQDRRAVVYNIKRNTAYYKTTTFLIYSAGLSPSGKLGAIAYNENNEISIFNTKTKKDLHILKDNQTTITNIIFISENEILVSSDDNRINYYKID